MQTVWREIWKTWIKLWIRGHFVQKRTEFTAFLPLKCVLGFFVGRKCQIQFNFSGLKILQLRVCLSDCKESSRQFVSKPGSAPANTLETTCQFFKTIQKWYTTQSAPNSSPNLANFSHSQKRHEPVKTKIQTPASFKTSFLKCVEVLWFEFYCNQQSSRPRKTCENTCFINFNKTRFFAIFRKCMLFYVGQYIYVMPW